MTRVKNLSSIFGNRSIRTIIAVPFIIQIILTAGIIGYLSIHNRRRSEAELFNKISDAAAAQTQKNIEHLLNESHQVLRANAIHIQYGGINQSGTLDLTEIFCKQIQENEDSQSIENIYFGDKNGNFVGNLAVNQTELIRVDNKFRPTPPAPIAQKARSMLRPRSVRAIAAKWHARATSLHQKVVAKNVSKRSIMRELHRIVKTVRQVCVGVWVVGDFLVSTTFLGILINAHT